MHSQNQIAEILFKGKICVMSINKTASFIIYRIREKGLEVFMLNKDKDGKQWELPQSPVAEAKALPLVVDEDLIELEPVKTEEGAEEQAFAMEGDWHDIPSLKSLIMNDVNYMRGQIKQFIPEAMEKGTFVALKEAFKKVMPHQYEILKELKDILSDRNSVKNI